MTALTPTPAEPSRVANLDLIGGHLCLDFANTASGRGGNRRLDHLQSFDDLILWSRRAGLLTPTRAAAIIGGRGTDPGKRTHIVARAVKLREAVHAIAAALAAGAPPPQSASSILGRTYRQAVAAAELVPRGHKLSWRWTDSEAWSILGPIAESAVVLFGSIERGPIKQCPGPDCGWVFVDLTKNRSRRWCDMKVCGNRAKLRRYHRRHRVTDS